MFKIEKDGSRQIHLRVPAAVLRRLKIMAASEDRTINEMLVEKVISLVAGADQRDGTEKGQ